jgi:hypothetical protein
MAPFLHPVALVAFKGREVHLSMKKSGVARPVRRLRSRPVAWQWAARLDPIAEETNASLVGVLAQQPCAPGRGLIH